MIYERFHHQESENNRRVDYPTLFNFRKGDFRYGLLAFLRASAEPLRRYHSCRFAFVAQKTAPAGSRLSRFPAGVE